MTYQDFIDLLKRWMPQTYWGPLENNPGWELYQAIAKLGERLSTAVSSVLSALLPSTAAGPETAVLTVDITPASFPATLKAGTLITREDGAAYKLTSDVAWSSDTNAQTCQIQGIVPSAQVSLPDVGSYSFDIFLLADGSTDIQYTVANPQNMTQGRAPSLDLLAFQRGILRMPGESDDALRARIRNIGVSVVTKDAIQQCIDNSALSDATLTEGFDLTPAKDNYFQIATGDYVSKTMSFAGYAYADQSYAGQWQDVDMEAKYAALAKCIGTRRAAGICWDILDSVGTRNGDGIEYTGGGGLA